MDASADSSQVSCESNLLCEPTEDPGLFAPGSKFLQFFIRHTSVRTFLQQEGQIFLYIQSMGLGHFHHCVNRGAGMGSAGSITEQPVFSADCKGPDAVFTGIVGKAASSILQIVFRIRLLVQGVGAALAILLPLTGCCFSSQDQKADRICGAFFFRNSYRFS